MSRRRVKLTYPANLVPRPVIYLMGHDFHVVTNIRRADVRDDGGWVLLELDGEEEEMDRAVAWALSLGVRVDPVGGDVVEG